MRGEFGMGALLDDLAAIDDDDPMRIAHRRQPMRNDEDGAALADRLANAPLPSLRRYSRRRT